MEITPTEHGPRMLADVLGEASAAGQHWWRADLHALNLVDTTAAGLANVATLGRAPDSFVPRSFQSYHEARPVSEVVSGVAGIFGGVGIGTRMMQSTSWLAQNTTSLAGRLGPNAQLRASQMFVDASRIADYDRMMGMAMTARAANLGHNTGRNTATAVLTGPLDDGAAGLRALTGARSYDQAGVWARNERLMNGVREGIGQELAIFAMMNQNEFLFPPDMGIAGLAGFAGLGIGLNAGIAHFMGRAVDRRAAAAAMQSGALGVDAARRAGMFVERDAATGMALMNDQMLQAVNYGLVRIEALRTNPAEIDRVVAAGGGGLSREAVLQDLAMAQRAMEDQGFEMVRRMSKVNSPEAVLHQGYGNTAALSRNARPAVADETLRVVAERTRQNPGAGFGLRVVHEASPVARMEDTLLGRYSALEDVITRAEARANQALAKAMQAGDVDAIRVAQTQADEARNAMNQLQNVRVATLEPSGVANYNVNRMPHYAETQAGSQGRLRETPDGLWDQGGSLRFRSDGSIAEAHGPGGVQSRPRFHEGLSAQEMTQAYTLAGRMSENRAATRAVFQTFMDDPSADWRRLPPQILDAIAAGQMQIEQSLHSHLAYGRVQQALKDRVPQRTALAHKFDWFKAHGNDLDLFDAEKALNLRLVEENGTPNALGMALMTWRDSPTTAKMLSVLGHPADHMNIAADDAAEFIARQLGELAAAFGNMPLPSVERLLSDGIHTGMEGGSSLLAHKAVQHRGVPVIYNNLGITSASEQQAAVIAATRNAEVQRQLTESQNPIVRSVTEAVRAESTSAQNAARVSEIVTDPNRQRNSAVTQMTFQERGNNVIQHAHAVGQRALRALEQAMKDNIQPIAEEVHRLFKHPQFARISAEVSTARQTVSRGVAMAEDAYMPGLNVIDTTRPQFARLLEDLGPLQNAPGPGQPWHLFDVTVAARTGEYVPIQMSDEAAGVLNRLVDADRVSLHAINELRRLQGRTPIERLNGHLPITDFNRYEVRYIMTPEGSVRYVRGRNAKDADRLANETLERVNKGRPDESRFSLVTKRELKDYHDMHDQVFLQHMQDMSGIKQTGTASGRSLDFRADLSSDMFDEMLVGLRNTYEDLARRTVAVNFNSSFAEAELALRRVKDTKKDGVFSSIENWQRALLWQSGLPEGSHIGRFHEWVTDNANWAMGRFADEMPVPMQMALRWLNDPQSMPAAQAARAQQAIAQHKPFAAFASLPQKDLMEILKVDREADSFRLVSALQGLNKATTYAFLQLANVAHPILNVTGLLVTSPATLRATMPMAGEAADQWARRVGPVADYLDNAKMQATLSPQKLMIEGFEHVWRDTSAMQEAARRGFIEPNLLEELNKLQNMRPTRFTEGIALLGKYTDFINLWLTPAQRAITGRDPSAFTLSERSETFTRAWAHMIGYSLSKRFGRDGMNEAAHHQFGHWFSNQNIADFAPNIRGDAWRGAAGVPFGLFQSFAINIYQRMFRYLEDGNKRALAVQAMTQSAMFGVGGLPGWNQLNALYFNTGRDVQADAHGATTLNERIYNRLGKDLSDVLMTGGLSSLPRLAGGESVNLYTSGDLNTRDFNVPPSVGMLRQVMQGAGMLGSRLVEEIEASLDPNLDADPMRVLEVLAHYAPSRGHRALADLAVGERSDRRGNLLVEDTRSGTALLARMLGTRTHNELQLQQGAWSNSQANAQRIADMTRVRDRMLRQVRDGELSEDQAAAYLARYLAAGGNPDQWNRWLAFTMEKAQMTRDQRLLMRLTNAAGEVMEHNYPGVRRVVSAVGADAAREGAIASGRLGAEEGSVIPSR